MPDSTRGKNPSNDELTFGIVSSQQYRSWSELQENFQWADESGWDSAWAFDHFFSLRDDDEMGECVDGWTLLGALAAVTERVQLGLMVTGITHRLPAVLFKQAVTVDQVSNGRCILGVGAAWNEREHEAFGIPFPPPGDRVDMFGEALEMNRLLETQERTTFEGKHYSLSNAPFEPKPVNGHIPILVGSTGKRMMRHVARYADLWDGGGNPEEYAEYSKRLDQLCTEIGRDGTEIRRAFQKGTDAVASEDAFREHVKRYAAAGVRTFLMVIPLGSPDATLRRIADDVIPELREAFKAGKLG